MNRTLFACALGSIAAIATIAGATPKLGANVSGPIAGQLVSAYGDTNAGAALYIAPSKTGGFFTLTQVCLRANNAVSLVGNTIGTLASRRNGSPGTAEAENDLGQCVTYTPGLVIPASENLTCQSTDGSGPSWCIITGIKSPAPPA